MAKRKHQQRRKAHNKRADLMAEASPKSAAASAQDDAPKNMRAHVLFAAERAVNGSRDVAYGQPENNFGRIAIMWNAYLDARQPKLRGEPINEGDVAIFNILLKIGRLAGNPVHIDSWIDIAGYAACGAEVTSKP